MCCIFIKKDDSLFETILKEKIMVQDIEKKDKNNLKRIIVSEAERYFYRMWKQTILV